jgi:predicted O-methyltransferase YrrM
VVVGTALLAARAVSAPAPITPAPLTPAPVAGKAEPEVPYVPTDERVVDAMLQVANVGKNDVLYDLGAGDGRIVITAARRFGTRGVGVDIDPDRVREARDNAKKAGVTNRVTFIQQDLFDTNISEATVVTLYLLPAVNLRLRPKLLSELKPGTRVVSHNYDMGDWRADKTLEIKLANGNHTVYFWVVPPRAASRQ